VSNDSAFKLISQEPLTISADAAWPRRRGDRMSTGMTAPGQGLPCWATDRSSGISPESGGAPAGAAAMGRTGLFRRQMQRVDYAPGLKRS